MTKIPSVPNLIYSFTPRNRERKQKKCELRGEERRVDLFVERRARVEVLTDEGRNGNVRDLKKLRDPSSEHVPFGAWITYERPLDRNGWSKGLRFRHWNWTVTTRQLVVVVVVIVGLWLSCCGGVEVESAHKEVSESAE